jgi:hypothetical protein
MSRPVTRSQTAARRAAEAAEAARILEQRQSIEAIAAEEVREANSAFQRTSATDVLAYHRQSARAAFVSNRRPIALTAQLLNYIDNMRNLPQNALVQLPTSRRRSSRAPSSAQISRLRTIANTRRIMEKKISSIYQISQELYTFLDIDFIPDILANLFIVCKISLNQVPLPAPISTKENLFCDWEEIWSRYTATNSPKICEISGEVIKSAFLPIGFLVL